MSARAIGVTRTRGITQNCGIASVATAHIASMTDGVTPKFLDHTEVKADGVTLAIAGHYRALISQRSEESRSVPMRKSTLMSCGV